MKNFIYLPLIIFFTFISNAYSVEIPACQRNADGRYVFDDSTNEGCAVPADEYRFTLYQVGLCRNFPDFPAITPPSADIRNGTDVDNINTSDNNSFPPGQPALVNNPDNCTTLLRSTNGTQVSIINGGQVTGLVGDQGSQPNPEDKYTHVFAVVGTSLRYSSNVTFTEEQTTGDGVSNSTVGVKCWTKSGEFQVSSVFGGGLPEMICGPSNASLSNFGLITQITDCYEPILQVTSGNLGFATNRCFYQLDTRNNVGIWLTNNNLQKATTVQAAQRIVFVQRLATPLVGVGQNSSSLTLKFSTSEAVGLIPFDEAAPLQSRNSNLTYATQGNFKFFVDLK